MKHYCIYIAVILLLILIFFNIIFRPFEGFTKKNGVLFMCQGCTDIMNHLGLIKYYSEKYDKLFVCSLLDYKNVLAFYNRKSNVENIIYEREYDSKDKLFEHISKNYDILENSDYLFHGWYDENRIDTYKNLFQDNMNKDSSNFVNLFYSSYDIPVSVRIDSFVFERDYELENRTYDNFVQEHGDKYILYHSNDNDNFIDKICKDCKYINLNRKSDIFFDYIKILEKSIELHVIDSCWGCFIYLLDCKYRLFKDKKIYLYPQRNYIKMFQDPVKLDNWIFV
jgi:hypothetical protein